jgi:hypothetical protein
MVWFIETEAIVGLFFTDSECVKSDDSIHWVPASVERQWLFRSFSVASNSLHILRPSSKSFLSQQWLSYAQGGVSSSRKTKIIIAPFQNKIERRWRLSFCRFLVTGKLLQNIHSSRIPDSKITTGLSSQKNSHLHDILAVSVFDDRSAANQNTYWVVCNCDTTITMTNISYTGVRYTYEPWITWTWLVVDDKNSNGRKHEICCYCYSMTICIIITAGKWKYDKGYAPIWPATYELSKEPNSLLYATNLQNGIRGIRKPSNSEAQVIANRILTNRVRRQQDSSVFV